MSLPSEDTAVAVSTATADDHVKQYYNALEHDHNSIPSFYLPQHTLPEGTVEPAIVFNGNALSDAAAFREMYKQIGPMHYDVQTYDCQVVNPAYSREGVLGPETSKGKNMTILVIVSGSVKVGPIKESELKGFSETFVLVPNPEAQKAHGRRGKPLKEWLIQYQNFRFVA